MYSLRSIYCFFIYTKRLHCPRFDRYIVYFIYTKRLHCPRFVVYFIYSKRSHCTRFARYIVYFIHKKSINCPRLLSLRCLFYLYKTSALYRLLASLPFLLFSYILPLVCIYVHFYREKNS